MEAWLVVWLVVGLVTTGVLLVMLGFLVRHVILLGRTASRMQEELQPIADDLAAASARAADTAAHLSERARPTRKRPPAAGAPDRLPAGRVPNPMLNVGPLELLVVLAVALIVVGPERLPELARSVGRVIRQFRDVQNEVRDLVSSEVDDADVRGAVDEFRKATGGVPRATDVKGAVRRAETTIRDETAAIRTPRPARGAASTPKTDAPAGAAGPARRPAPRGRWREGLRTGTTRARDPGGAMRTLPKWRRKSPRSARARCRSSTISRSSATD